MSLISAIEEIEAITPSLTHNQMLEALKQRVVAVDGLAQSGEAIGYFLNIGKYAELKELATGSSHSLEESTVDLGDGIDRPMKEIAGAVLDTILYRDGIDFSVPQVQALGWAFVISGFMTSDNLTELMALGRTTELEFPNITLRSVIMAREPTLAQESESNVVQLVNRKNRNQLLIVNLLEDLPDRASLQYKIRASFDGVFGEWEGSSIAGLVGKRLSGVYSARLPGEMLKSDLVEIKVVCPFNKPLELLVEG